MTSASLRIEDVTVRFAGLTALDSLTVDVLPGQIHALIGPNGAGKSTCFNVVSGVYRATSGTVLLDGEPINHLRPDQIAARGVARGFQNVSLSKRRTVADYLWLGRHHLTRAGALSTALMTPKARRERRLHEPRVREIAEFMGLGNQISKIAGDLSYGEQKRVDIARALCMEPSLLILDEPAAGMNGAETEALAEHILSIREQLGISVVLIEHDMGLVMSISDQVTVLDFGKKVAEGTPEQVQNDPEVLRAYLGQAPADGQDPLTPEGNP